MKTYCTQNGDCTTCSLVNYGRDCKNNLLIGDEIEDKGNNQEDLNALIAACREALDRIEKNQNIILENIPGHAGIIETMEKLNATRTMAII